MGHLVIAAIAYEHLTPTTRQQVDQLMGYFKQEHPQYDDFVLAAPWPDDLRSQGVKAYNTWHYINVPIKLSKAYFHYRRIHRENVQWAIAQSLQVMQSPNVNPYEKVRFLLFLTHFVGDIHQPLHVVSLYSKQTPRGDRGGNLFKIDAPGLKMNNLHSLWDNTLGSLPHHAVGTDNILKQVQANAKTIEQRYPEAYFGSKVQDLNTQDWIKEGKQIARKDVYGNIQYGGQPSKAYLQRGQKIAQQRLALAGYRLAAMLNACFDRRKQS